MLQTRKFHLKPIFVFNILFLLQKKNFPKDQYLQKPQITLKTDVENPEISLRNRASKTRNTDMYISETENFSYKAIGGKTEQIPLYRNR